MQAQFICLAHNLMLIFEDWLKKEGVDNEIENKRKIKRLKKSLTLAQINKEALPIFLTTPKRPTQRSVKFIRWLRNNLFMNTSWRNAVGSLERIYAVFGSEILDTVVSFILYFSFLSAIYLSTHAAANFLSF